MFLLYPVAAPGCLLREGKMLRYTAARQTHFLFPTYFSPQNYNNGVVVLSAWTWPTAELTSKKKTSTSNIMPPPPPPRWRAHVLRIIMRMRVKIEGNGRSWGGKKTFHHYYLNFYLCDFIPNRPKESRARRKTTSRLSWCCTQINLNGVTIQ